MGGRALARKWAPRARAQWAPRSFEELEAVAAAAARPPPSPSLGPDAPLGKVRTVRFGAVAAEDNEKGGRMQQRVFQQGELVTWTDASGQRHRGRVLQHVQRVASPGAAPAGEVLVLKEGTAHVSAIPPAAVVHEGN